MAKMVYEQVIPEIQRLKPSYTADETWSDAVLAVIRRVSRLFIGDAFNQQAMRIARRTVSMEDADNEKEFLKSVNAAVGVDFNFLARSASLEEYLSAAVADNVSLIKSVPEQYFQRIESVVLDNMRAGFAPSKIAKDIQAATGITSRRAKFIARDQVAKLNGDLTKRRNKDAGIEHFRWVTSKDARVGDDHRRAAERDVGFGPGVYKWDRPPAEGIPGHSTRPNCRCTAAPVLAFQLKQPD